MPYSFCILQAECRAWGNDERYRLKKAVSRKKQVSEGKRKKRPKKDESVRGSIIFFFSFYFFKQDVFEPEDKGKMQVKKSANRTYTMVRVNLERIRVSPKLKF